MPSPFPDVTDTAVAARWDANADQWTADVRAGFDIYRERFTWPAFERFSGDLQGLNVVDLGCGEGTNTRAMARRGAMMTGIDLSERLIAHASAAEAEHPLGIRYHVASFSAPTGLPGAGFDAAVSTLALMDGADFARAMREAFRLIRPGGFLAFSVLHPCFITRGLRWERGPEGDISALLVAGYFDGGPFTQEWRFSSRPPGETVPKSVVPRFPRTLGDYLNAVVGAGFRITGIGEPVPPDDLVAEHMSFARWRDLGAFLLMVRAERP